MRKPLIAGNWKMQGNTQKTETLLAGIAAESVNLPHVEWAVFPPYVYLPKCAAALSNTAVRWGAQDVSMHDDGAYTGEISAAMLKDLGCQYVIIGHSERRQWFSEKNDCLVKKCEKAFSSGLTPIFCVGETLPERQQGLTWSIVQEQLEVVFILKDNCSAFGDWVIAYEPVWAIGTGQSATPDQAQTVHAAIRQHLAEKDKMLAQKTRLLYGGSVKPENAQALLSQPDIDGALVGGASLDAKLFLEIGRLCKH